MAVMQNSERIKIWAELMEALSRINESCGILTKPELKAAVDATDQWISDNAISFNQALPIAARTALTAPQKARLLAVVVLKRFNTGV